MTNKPAPVYGDSLVEFFPLFTSAVKENMIITEEIHLFRETARHLWNSYLMRDADFDSVDVFKDICLKLFEKQILLRLELDGSPIPIESERPYLREYRLFREGNGKLPIQVNRDLPPSGYWDYPIDWIPPEEKPVIHPICFFDFDLIGWRKMEYYRARIINCTSHPELSGRDALIRCDYTEIEFIGKEL